MKAAIARINARSCPAIAMPAPADSRDLLRLMTSSDAASGIPGINQRWVMIQELIL